jgi:predicted ATPase
MRYTSFQIKNFKGITDLTLDFSDSEKQIWTLVGLNESGKTTILEAMNIIHTGFSTSKAESLIPRDKVFSFNESISVKAIIEFSDVDKKAITEILKKDGLYVDEVFSSIAIEKKLSFHNSNAAENGTQSLWWDSEIKTYNKPKGKSRKCKVISLENDEYKPVSEFIKRSLPSVIYYDNFLFDFPKKIYLNDSSDLQSLTPRQKAINEQYKTVLQDVLYSYDSSLTIEKLITDRLKDSTGNKALKSSLQIITRQLSSLIMAPWQDIFVNMGQAKIEIDSEYDPEAKSHYLQIFLTNGGEQYEISERSLGFKWFFSFLLFTEVRKHRIGQNEEIIFLLDEPASNLHSTAQKKLLDKFVKIVDTEQGKSNCKLIYTTHSHHLINPKFLDSTYIVRNTAVNYNETASFDSPKTNIEAILYKQFVSQYPDQQDYFQPILDTLEYQPSLLEKVPSLIITEGKNDYYTFKYMNDIILSEDKRFNFYPGTGADNQDFIIRLYLSWGSQLLVLLDGDKPGVKAQKRYITDIGDCVKSKVITLIDVNDKWDFATEFLFSEADRTKIMAVNPHKSGAYDKSTFNSNMRDLYAQGKTLEFEETTIQNFKDLFEFLSAKISI